MTTIPTSAIFTTYDVAPPDMADLATFDPVDIIQHIGQVTVDAGDISIISGVATLPFEADVIIETTIPEEWSLLCTLKLSSLPNTFTNVSDNHVFVGAVSSVGVGAGLFFSKVGMTYVGAVDLTGGVLTTTSTTQYLEDSDKVVEEGDEYYTLLLVTSYLKKVTYVHYTKTADLIATGSHRLLYVLPAFDSSQFSTSPVSRTVVAVKSTTARAAIKLNRIALAPTLVVPNLPPIAKPGPDKAMQLNSIVELDGSGSVDQEGAVLSYQWRLIDAPYPSTFTYGGCDGVTYPLADPVDDGFTKYLYSYELGEIEPTNPVVVGDVIVLNSDVITIVGKGTDVHGFYVQFEHKVVPKDLAAQNYRLYRQFGLSQATEAKARFYPDVAGLYQFDLTVNDGNFDSDPAVVVVSAAESAIPRGITPDAKFIWNYLPSFWRLVENKERITTCWSAMAQVAATEMLNLWQIDYSKSLRDVQRTKTRKWLHMDPKLEETLLEGTTVAVRNQGIYTIPLPDAAIDYSGQVLNLKFTDKSITLTLPPGSLLTPSALRSYLAHQLVVQQTGIKVYLLASPDANIIRLYSNEPFESLPTTTLLPFLTYIGGGSPSTCIQFSGAAVGRTEYKASIGLANLNIQEDDLLSLSDGTAYKIARLQTNLSDLYPYQRIITKDPLPINAPIEGSIGGQITSSRIDFESNLVEKGDCIIFEVVENDSNSFTSISGEVIGVCSSAFNQVSFNCPSLGYYTNNSKYSVYFDSVIRKKYIPIDDLIVDVPTLQENIVITDDTSTLRRNADFFIDSYRGKKCIRFTDEFDVFEGKNPPNRLWAEYVHEDNRPVIESNFGIPADFTLDKLSTLPASVDYLSAVKGLWYSYTNGPTMRNIRIGVQILLGLPFAEEKGTIEEIRDDFGKLGRILIRDIANTQIVRSYTFPAVLHPDVNPATGLQYVVGDIVEQFAPLTDGAEVVDWVSEKDWFKGYVQQGFEEVSKYHKFLVRVDSEAFDVPSLMFVTEFIMRIKPKYTLPMFIVQADIGDTGVTVSDDVGYTGFLNLHDGGNFRNAYGAATMFDQGSPQGTRTQRSNFDTACIPADEPMVNWGFDQNYLSPEDTVHAVKTMILFTPTLPLFDSIFDFDRPLRGMTGSAILVQRYHLWKVPGAGETIGWVIATPLIPGSQASSIGTFVSVTMQITGYTAGTPEDFNLVIKHEGTVTHTIPFSASSSGNSFTATLTPSLVTTSGDRVDILIVPQSGLATSVEWHQIMVVLGSSGPWQFDVVLPTDVYAMDCVM